MAAKELSLSVWLSFYILLTLSTRCTATEFTEEMVIEWANNIGKEVYQYTTNITHVEDLQRSYEGLNLSTTAVEWEQLLKETKNRIEGYFDKKTQTLKNIVNKAEHAYCAHQVKNNLKKKDIKFPDAKKLDDFLNETGITLEYNSLFQQKITLNSSVVHVPTDVYDGAASIVNGIHWSEALNEEFSKNAKADPTLKWQYFASNTGFTRFYPGHKWKLENGQVDLYDARSRSWFIQGGTSPKDVVILLDTSGSMRGVPMSLAKLSAKALIDTFEENDYFNIVWFNEKADVLVKCNHGLLLQATVKNKQVAKEIIDDPKSNLEGENMAKWKTGLNMAFTLLETSRESGNTSNCQQAIMIFSDGTTADLKEYFIEKNPKKMVRVFTFPVGPPAESTTAMLQMSRENRGYFSRIQSVGAVRSVSKPYIQVLSRPMARAPKANTTESTVWTGAYLDAMGLGMMVTGTLPVFYRPNLHKNCSSKAQKESYDHLIGVAGTDVPLRNLHEFFLQPLMGDNGYALVVNNNGLVAFHPRLKTVYGYLPNAPGVDLIDAEFPLDKERLIELRRDMVDKTFLKSSSRPVQHSFDVYDISTDELRVVKRRLHLYVDSLQGTSFSFAIASPKLGFKYKLQSDALIGEITKELNSSNLALEKWPYCEWTFSSDNPVDHLKNKYFSQPSSKCNSDLIKGLAVDLKATSGILNKWTVDKNLKSVFVRTHYGVTRQLPCSSCSGGGDYRPNQRDIGRLTSFDQQSIVYTSPYNQGRRERNSSSVIALQKVLFKNQTVAVVGYEMQSSSFAQLIVDKTKKCSSSNCADVNCDRTGKNDHEGLYCYLLDENGFVVSSNTGKSSGMFFGKVDYTIMKQLIRQNDSSSTGFYNKITFTDYQAVCEQKAGIASTGTSLFTPMLSISSYVDWWTSKAWWFLAYFNVYSWMMCKTTSIAAASEDKPKNESCIKEVTTYYANTSSVLRNGSAQLDSCLRDYIVKSVPQSNLYLVVIDAKCGLNKDPPRDMDIPGEPKDVKTKIKCQTALHRKRPQRCFTSDYKESEYPPGHGSSTRASLLLIVLAITLSLVMKSHV